MNFFDALLILAQGLSIVHEPLVVRKRTPHPPQRKAPPWKNIHLSKAERKGKTYLEIQALRRQKWEHQRNAR